MEESVHGSAQCEEHAGRGAVQLGEVQLHCGLLTGLAGGCRGSLEPARKHQTGMRLTLNSVGNPIIYLKFFLCAQIKRPLIHAFISWTQMPWSSTNQIYVSPISSIWSSKWNPISSLHSSIK